MKTATFYLKIQQVDQVCLFELSWGQGQNIGVTLAYPENLTALYQEWQRIYLLFYNTALRGQVAEMGSFAVPPVDWHAKLVQAEAQLLYVFHHWLRSAELYDIRANIAQATRENIYVDIFLTCNPLNLSRFPWEVWEIGTEFALDASKIRIVRTPINRREAINNSQHYGRKARILVILGDETGLNFQAEKAVLKKIEHLIYPEFIGWQPGKNIEDLKNQIVKQIAATPGWDILFFAGHSNETNLTGGEIAIAPHTALSISELEPCLTIAKERGLQVAIFNSCNGLSIANKLIDLGISQVAVMREPIHNRVAEEFLSPFLTSFCEYKDVHTSLLEAAKYLKSEKHLTYPSAYLIPSLFRHPEASLFRLQPFGIKQNIKKLIPIPQEAIALSALLILSLQQPVQSWLLERRVLAQAIYLQMTNQVANVPSNPPVVLVQIDEQSIRKAQISDPKPMNRQYLASLVNRLVANQAKVIGIDYLLDRHQPQNDSLLAKSLQAAVSSSPQPTWFVLAETYDKNGVPLRVIPEIANLNWSLTGEIENYPWYMELLSPDAVKSQNWHFASLLTLAYQLQQIPNSPQPKLTSKTDFLQQIREFINDNNQQNQTILKSQPFHLQLVTALSYFLGQMWMHPIIDFSIPPEKVYKSIPAWQILQNQNIPPNLEHKIVIIAAGGYDEAGISQDGEDNFVEPPLAYQYWRPQIKVFTGGEYHAYIIQHFLTQRLVVPIPDLWVIGIMICLGKALYLFHKSNPKYRWRWLIVPTIITGVYGIVSLQFYISLSAVLLPWFLPSVTLWFYVIFIYWEKKADA